MDKDLCADIQQFLEANHYSMGLKPFKNKELNLPYISLLERALSQLQLSEEDLFARMKPHGVSTDWEEKPPTSERLFTESEIRNALRPLET